MQKEIANHFRSVKSEEEFNLLLEKFQEELSKAVSPEVLSWIATPPLATIDTRRMASYTVMEVVIEGLTPTTRDPKPLTATDIMILMSYRSAIAKDEKKREKAGGHLLPFDIDRVGLRS